MKFESVIKVGMERRKLNFSLKNLQLCILNMTRPWLCVSLFFVRGRTVDSGRVETGEYIL